jgi:hypothetical protein
MNAEEHENAIETGTDVEPASDRAITDKHEVRVDPKTGELVRYYNGIRQIRREVRGPPITTEFVRKLLDEMEIEEYLEKEQRIAERFLDVDSVMRDA